MSIKENIEAVADEAIALIVVGGTMTVTCYQAIMGADVSMPAEAMMMVLAFYFVKKSSSQ